jgi:hypothetical protein
VTAAVVPTAATAPSIISEFRAVQNPPPGETLICMVDELFVPSTLAIKVPVTRSGPAVNDTVANPCALVVAVTELPAAAPAVSDPALCPPPPSRNSTGKSGTGSSFSSVTWN